MTKLTQKAVFDALQAGQAKAAELGTPVSMVVLDEGGHLLGFLRCDGASFGTGDVAQRKAYTAAAMHLPTAALSPLAQPGEVFYGLEVSGGAPYVLFPGGVPVVVDGNVLGAVGVSGGPPDGDVAIAEAMCAALV
ncbi:GlcG/HbpS family heme-binding protein [Celeribacter litoreus]|uniref:GlcG/HbpS family heme-binding protein n=1 Tax=Celeribacter litoreus TaxID=2876714 RepID=UPI001CCCF714|nr:heme-binding protein [Celeribacter litoreus]MCA0042525.1 heme-binding protein [Celeribacter litoreus]